jgi:hypothetical protein
LDIGDVDKEVVELVEAKAIWLLHEKEALGTPNDSNCIGIVRLSCMEALVV